MLDVFELIASKGICRPYRADTPRAESLSSLIMILDN